MSHAPAQEQTTNGERRAVEKTAAWLIRRLRLSGDLRAGDAVARAVKGPVIADRLVGNGVDPLGSTPKEFARLIAADIALWAEAIRSAGIEPGR